MIKVEDGTVIIDGSTLDVISDFTCIVASVRDALIRKYNKEFADNVICICGKLAVYQNENGSTPPDDHELTKQFLDVLKGAKK